MTEPMRDRVLGPEMIAEGWKGIGDWIWWLHVPSSRGVSLTGPDKFGEGEAPGVPDRPADPETLGYFISCHHVDELGNPSGGETFWVESYADAIRHVRRLRLEILAQAPKAQTPAEQLTLDEAPRTSPGSDLARPGAGGAEGG